MVTGAQDSYTREVCELARLLFVVPKQGLQLLCAQRLSWFLRGHKLIETKMFCISLAAPRLIHNRCRISICIAPIVFYVFLHLPRVDSRYDLLLFLYLHLLGCSVVIQQKAHRIRHLSVALLDFLVSIDACLGLVLVHHGKG
jgi:hypothetical protein